MQDHRDYCIFQCNRCECYRGDPEPRPKDFALKYRIGWCNASEEEIPVIEDPQLTLVSNVIPCVDRKKGKVRRKEPSRGRKKEKKNENKNSYQGRTLEGI